MNNWNISQVGSHSVASDRFSFAHRSPLAPAGALWRSRRLLTLAVATIVIAAGFLRDARADITTGLVGYWNLSDGTGSSNAVDSSGNGNTGTLVNYADATYNNMWTTSTDPTNGWPFALLFTNSLAGFGTNTYVSVPDSTSLNLPSGNKTWTLAAWVNCSVAGGSEPANGGIICKGNLNAEAYSLYMSGGHFVGNQRNAGNTGGQSVSSTLTPVAGVWYHVAVTFTTAGGASHLQMAMYTNGVFSANSPANTYTTVYVTNLPVTIGARAAANGSVTLPFEGSIDEVRIYDRALSASDILQLYQNKAFTLNNNGIGSWNGLAGSGGNAALDTSSLNFCTNLFSAPVGTSDSLADVLNLEAANSLSLGCTFADAYYSGGSRVVVASTNLTIATGGVAVGTASGAGTLNFENTALTYIVNSSDSIGIKDGANPSSVVVSGQGTVIFTGINSYSGGATINSGTVQIGNGGAITGQELGSSSSVTDNGALVFDGNNALNYSKNINGNGSVTQEGSGALTLSGSNGYTNATTIANATLKASSLVDGSGSIGSGPLNLTSGSLIYTGTGDSTARQVNGTAGTTNTIDIATGNTLEITGRVTSTAAWAINKNNGGTLTLSGSGDNSFLGVNLNAGTLILNKTSGTGHAIGNPLNVASGATVQLSGSGYPSEIYSNAAAPVTISSGGVFDANGQSDNWNALSLSGTGIGGTGALINSAASTTSTLTIGAGTTLAANTTVGGPGNIMLPNPVAGSGSLTYDGTGVLTLQGTNTYTGGTFITSGTVDGNAALSIPGNVTLSGTGVFQVDSIAALFPSATLTLPASPAASSVNLTYSGTQNIGVLIIGSTRMPAGLYGASATNPNNAFTGSGLLNVVEPYWDANGTDASNGTNTFGGGSGNWSSSVWWVDGNTDTTWAASNIAYFAGTAGVVTLNANETANGLFFLTPGYNITNTDGVSQLSLGGNNPIVNVPSGTTTIGCMLTGGGTSQGLTASGPGTLNLTGNNSYTGGTLVTSNATLNVNTISDSGTSAIANSGNLTLSSGSIGYTGASAATTARIVTSVPGTTNAIDVAPGTSLALNGSVNGGTATAINKTDTGTLFLGGTTDNASLNMNINGGMVVITKASISTAHGLGGGTSSVGSGAELQLAGTGVFQLFNTCALTVNSGGMLDVNSQSDSFGTFTLSGTGIGGAGALINSTTASNSFLTNGGSGVVLAGATTVGGTGNIALVSAISGTGPLTYAGSGTLTLGGAGSYTGGTTINAGSTVTLNNSASGAGTGTITEVATNSTLNVGIVGNNVILNNAISGPGIVNIVETASDNLQLGGSMSTFTGVINCPASATTAKTQILTTNVNLSSAATINVAAGGTLLVENSGVVIPCPLNLFGAGNSEVYGALRIEVGALISGPVTLFGNTTMGNSQSGSAKLATISGPISQSNGTFGVTFTAEPGTIALSGTSTFGGGILISGGEVEIGGNGSLGSGSYAANITNNSAFVYASSAAQTLSGVMSGTGQLGQSGPGTLSLTQTNTFTGAITITNGSTLTIGGAGSLGATPTSNSYAGSISNYGTLNYASSAAQFLPGNISGTGTLQESGPGTLTLSGTDIYTGPTTVGSGATLAIASIGSIGNTASVGLAAGATFDVSAYALSYTLAGGTTLKAAGTGTNVGTTAATIKGGSSGTVDVNGPLVLTFTPTLFSGDTNHPALYASQGVLNLNGSSTTISNAAATPLGLGTYTLVEVAGGSLGVASTNVSVTGTGLAAGTAPMLSVSGGNLNLVVVASGATPKPGINSVTFSGGNIIFSGTNGSPNGTYTVISTTNVALPRSSWTPVATNTFSGAGTFSVTNSDSGSSRRFFSIQVP